MTIYDPFDVVVVPFPFTDKAKQKPRPALVISRRNFNASHGNVILLMITTAAQTQWPSDVPISSLKSAGLPSAWVVRFKMFTLDESIITKKIGVLSNQDRVSASASLKQILIH
jgi:mRNA interferase MazF